MTGRYENVDGHRVWTETSVAPGDAPSRPVSPETPAPDQQGGTGALPRFSVTADYRTCLVAVLFDPDDIPTLAAHPLFADSADLLHAAAVDIEQEIESQILTARDRQISGGTR